MKDIEQDITLQRFLAMYHHEALLVDYTFAIGIESPLLAFLLAHSGLKPLNHLQETPCSKKQQILLSDIISHSLNSASVSPIPRSDCSDLYVLE